MSTAGKPPLERRRSLRLKRRAPSPAACPRSPAARKRARRSRHKLPGGQELLQPARPLTDLPLAVLERIVLFLDVSSLEKVGLTCTFLHQLVSSNRITTIDFPFSVKFLKQLQAASTIEKKPVLRLRSTKADEASVPDDTDVFMDYMVSSQLALLSLDQLQELVLVPDLPDDEAWRLHYSTAGFVELDHALLRGLAQRDCLRCVTRLDILVDRNCYIDEHMDRLPSLLYLGLTVTAIKALSTDHFENFLCRLEATVTACRAPELSVRVLTESRRKVKKVFVNAHVERLTVSAPCNFNLHLALERVREVTVLHPEPARCTYHRSPAADRLLHRSGLCVVSLASVFQRCPNIVTFAGVHIGHVGMDQTFAKWNTRVKKLFHNDYMSRGGEQELRAWGRARGGRWFVRQEDVPAGTGHGRVEF